MGEGGRGGKLGSFRVIGGWQDGGGAEIGFVSHFLGVGGVGYPAGGTGGLYRWIRLRRAILFGWAWFVTPPVFGVALSSILRCIIPDYSIFVKC